MKLRDVLKALDSLHRFELIELRDYEFYESYRLKDLMEFVDDNEVLVMDADVEKFSTQNNVVTIWGYFNKVNRGMLY